MKFSVKLPNAESAIDQRGSLMKEVEMFERERIQMGFSPRYQGYSSPLFSGVETEMAN